MTLGIRNWEIIRLHPLIKEARIPYQPRFRGPIRLWEQLINNSSKKIKKIDAIKQYSMSYNLMYNLIMHIPGVIKKI